LGSLPSEAELHPAADVQSSRSPAFIITAIARKPVPLKRKLLAQTVRPRSVKDQGR
jgi:hypothetical protein